MNWKRVSAGLLVLIGGVIFWQAGWKFNKQQVLSAADSISIEDRLSNLERRVAALEKINKSKTTTNKSQSFVQLTSGTVTSGDWALLPGSEFWLDQGLYGSNVQVSWEGWLKTANGSAMARLYDLTNHRAVDLSEVVVKSEVRASFYSPVLAIWRGQNQYRIELKSSTGYPVTISEARLKIITQ